MANIIDVTELESLPIGAVIAVAIRNDGLGRPTRFVKQKVKGQERIAWLSFDSGVNVHDSFFRSLGRIIERVG